MGIKSRKAKHSKRMARKREAKQARRNAYAALSGTSRKTKRSAGRKQPTGQKHAHVMANCGNVGCTRCYPQFA